jgi:hypothetical protein
MAGRDRTTLGLGLIVAVLAMTAREHLWLQVPLALFAVFLMVWGREPKRTEAFIRQMPGGRYLQRGLRHLDLILSPRDLELEQHFREVLSHYSPHEIKVLRQLWLTRNPNNISHPFHSKFFQDGLTEHHMSPSQVKEELRETVGRLLDELGA